MFRTLEDAIMSKSLKKCVRTFTQTLLITAATITVAYGMEEGFPENKNTCVNLANQDIINSLKERYRANNCFSKHFNVPLEG